ncbi:hypothetical protein QS257_21265 [Terrilactibacillus sp. S3-3]|nr:hypothetical protein QS257_21265 [Terrilactibacillus sp. S3-3]
MIFKDLLNKVKWAEIEKGLKTLYGLENSAPYKGIFEKLLAEQPIVNENLKICVEKTEDGYDVFGLENNESLALELTSWKEWLGFSVCTADMSPSDFCCSCALGDDILRQ